LKAIQGFERKEAQTLPRDHAVPAGEDALKESMAVLEGVLNFHPLEDMLQSLKREVDTCLIKLEMGLELNGARIVGGPE